MNRNSAVDDALPRERAEARFSRLYQDHAREILGYALRRSADPEDAADVLAETFLVAPRRLDDVPLVVRAASGSTGLRATCSPMNVGERAAGVGSASGCARSSAGRFRPSRDTSRVASLRRWRREARQTESC